MDPTSSEGIGEYLETGRRERLRRNHVAALSAFQAAAMIDPLNSVVQVELARELRALDRLNEATVVLDGVLNAEPSQVGALLERGHVRRRQGNREGAVAAFKAAAIADPQNRNIQVELARDLRALGRLEEADAVVNRILNLEPGQIGALIERGHIFRRRGDHAGAVTAFQAAVTVDPHNRNIQVELARDLRAIGRLEEADAVVNRILDLEPGQTGALIERGHIFRRRGDHAGAVTAFQAAVTVDPHNRNIQVELARDLRALGRLDEAEVALDEVLGAEPGKIGALIERGLVLRRRSDHAGAVTAFQAAVTVDPHNRNIQIELAHDLRALGRLDDADVVLSSVLDAEPRNFGALVERGHLQRQRRNHAKALAAFEAAAVFDPLNSGLQLEIVTELRALGRLPDAETILRKLIGADPNNLPAVVKLSHLMMDTNQLAKADRLLKNALHTNPNDHRIMVALGHLARRGGNLDAALHCFRSATEADPANLDLKLDYAAELREQGYFNDSLGLIRSVLNVDEKHWAGWMQLGQYYRAMDNSEAAIEAFRTAITKQPHRTQALVDLALENWAAGEAKEAAQLLQRALRQEPTHLGALIVSADRALLTERTDEALQLAQRAIQFHPGQLGPYLIAARSAAMLLDRTAALDFLDRACRIFGPLPDIVATQIHVYRQYRDHNSIRSLIAATSDQTNNSFPFWLESTSFAITVGDFERAERAMELAPAKSSKELARVHFLQAHKAEGRRQYAQAITNYQEALSLDPRNGGWHSEMARACLLLADIDGVRAHLKAAFSIDMSTKVAAGQSLNISQHHTGQLLDEFMLDSALLANLKTTIALPIDKRIDALKQLVRDNPDHTAPAIMLVLAMRQVGLFSFDEKHVQSDAVTKIPRKIIQFWNTETLPRDIGELTESWRANHSGYTHVLFNDVSADTFLAANYPREVCLAFQRARQPAQRADIFRLAYLALEGGYYIDVDDLCLARLDTFVPAYAEIVAYQENYATIANNFIGAVPHHPVIVRALKLAVEAVNRGDHDIVWLSTGPGLLTRTFAQIASETPWDDCLNRAVLLELWEAQRYIGLHCPAAYKNTDQHWSRAVYSRKPNNKAASSSTAELTTRDIG